jgi:hypothetical protein
MAPAYEIVGSCWRVSFQRRASGKNVGALPYFSLQGDARRGGTQHVLVPITGHESLWFGWTLSGTANILGGSFDGQEVGIVERVRGVFFEADTLTASGVTVPINTASLTPSSDVAGVTPQLWFEVRDATQELLWRLCVTLCTPQLYAQLSGCAPPDAASAADSYAGHLLP